MSLSRFVAGSTSRSVVQGWRHACQVEHWMRTEASMIRRGTSSRLHQGRASPATTRRSIWCVTVQTQYFPRARHTAEVLWPTNAAHRRTAPDFNRTRAPESNEMVGPHPGGGEGPASNQRPQTGTGDRHQEKSTPPLPLSCPFVRRIRRCNRQLPD